MNNFNNTTIRLRKYHTENTTHSHEFYQWVLPIQGTLELEVSKKAGYVAHNNAAFIHPGESHCFASLGENEFLVLDAGIDHSWMSSIDIPAFWNLTPALQNYLQFAKTYLAQQKNQGINEALVQDFLLKLLAQHFLSPFDKKIQLAKNWIDSYFSGPMDIKQVAHVSCLSASQLQRRFRRALGQSVGEYWRGVRLQQAKLLLKAGVSSIEQIALRVGYESVAAFSRSFSQAYGTPPSQWQNDSNGKKSASPG
ncbi:MAG TPA: AraC family transcriptional regulator [Gammaproteobacteria bacterium]|nr:AraC family transcriptional regulator [Gammaproteobacteria bacterium]